MEETLARVLLKNALVSAQEIDEALKQQVVHGGSLGTLLLEAGAISEDALLKALGETHGLPTIGKDEIDKVESHIPRLFPLIFAETYRLVPYRLIGQNLGVALNRPPDEQLFARIRERVQLFAQPALTTEVRLHYAMNRLYKTELTPRYRALLDRLDGTPETPPSEPADPNAPSKMLSWGLPVGRISRTHQGPRKREPLDTDKLLTRMAAAEDRDTIVNVLLEAVLTTFEFAAIFLVQGEQINGWRGPDPQATERVARVSLAVELPSVFQTIYATHGHYLGPLPNNSVNLRLVEELDRQPPRAAFLAPLLVGGKLAGIIFADNGTRGVPSKRVASILLLTHRAGMCFEALIRHRKTTDSDQETDSGPETTPHQATLLDEGEFEVLGELSPPPMPVVSESLDAAVTEQASAGEHSPPAAEETPAEPVVTFDLNEAMTAPVLEEIPETPEEIDFPPPASPPHPSMPPPGPPPLPAQPIKEPSPTPTFTLQDTEDAEEDESLWDSVQLESLDTSHVTGGFDTDSAPGAATAEFLRGIKQSASEPETPAQPKYPAPTPDYVAFSDINESPEESVGEWEDVFVETVAAKQAKEVPRETAPMELQAPPAVTWETVVAEIERAPTLTTIPSSAQVEVAGTMVDEREILFDSLDAADPEVWRSSVDKLLAFGSGVDDVIESRFPGNIRIDPFAPGAQLPAFSVCSGVTALIAARGANAASVVLPFLESNDRTQRFFAIYFLYAVHYPPALELLARRLYDSEPKNRFLAADALRCYPQEMAYKRIIQGLRDHLKVPVFEAQVATVQVLGQLRDPSAVPSLIPLVVSPRQALSRAASSALTVICGQSFGTEVARWAEWWQTHFNKPRESWLLEGMRHPDPNVRNVAAREFQFLTGQTAPSDSGATPEQGDDSTGIG